MTTFAPRSAGPSELAARRDTVGALILDAADRAGGVALTRPGTPPVDYPDLAEAVREIAAGLIALGIGPGDRVAILAGTRPEWTLADVGSMCAGATVVPDLPDQLARGVRVRARPRRRPRGVLRGPRATRQGERGPRRVPGARARDPDRRRRARGDPVRGPAERRGRGRDERWCTSAWRASRRTTSRRSCTRRAPPDRRRAAGSRTRACSRPSRPTTRSSSCPPRSSWSSTCSCRSPTRSRGSRRSPCWRRRDARLLGRRPAADARGDRRPSGRPTSRRSRASTRRSTRRSLTGVGEQSRAKQLVFHWAAARGPSPARGASGPASGRRAREDAPRLADRLVLARVRGRVRRPARARR